MNTIDSILFSVSKELGKVVDYQHVPLERYQDEKCGDYLIRQAELALGGTYVPEETVYWLQADLQGETDIPSILYEVMHNGELEELPSISLRNLVFAHEVSAGGLPRKMQDTVKLLERINDGPDSPLVLGEYMRYHSEKADNIGERTVTAIQSGKGVLLFDDTGRGIQCMERYLQFLADAYFSTELEGTDSLGIHYFSTTNSTIVEDSRRCALMFTPESPHHFIPQTGIYYSKDLMKDYLPAVQCSMNPCKSDYDAFLGKFKLDRSDLMTDIAHLDEIHRNGIDIAKPGYGFLHESSFEKILEKLTYSYLKNPEHSPLFEALQKTAKDMAGRILRTEYNLRGYGPFKPEQKETARQKRQIKL